MKKMIRKCFYIGLGLFCYISAFAGVLQQGKFWPTVDLSGSFLGLPPILYDLSVQGRYNESIHEYERTLFEAGLGYKLFPNLSGWLGYRWILENANTNQEHRIWQQIIWDAVNTKHFQFSSRTRLSERKNDHQAEWAIWLRQRFTIRLPQTIANRFTPILYDEIFFNLNNPPWTNHRVVDQNRAFIGIEIPIAPIFKKANIQVGYLNQYIFKSPINEVNNILFVSLNMST
ncbi:MAG: DUF2490 domain-containing protein [Gammaproteobacteria bacterium]